MSLNKILVASLRTYDTQPVPIDIRSLKKDFKWGVAEGCLCMLVMKVETRTHSDDRPDLPPNKIKH